MIEYFFSGFDGTGIDGKPGKFDGKAFIVRTDPDYRGQRWVVARAKARRRGNHCQLRTEDETELEAWIMQHPEWVAEIEAKLAALQ